MKGTRWAIRPATKATSRDNRSSLATTTLHFAAFAAASCGKLRTPVQGIAALATFGLDVLGLDCKGFVGCETLDRRALGFQP